MNVDKHHILQLLREEFDRWEALLAGMREEEIIRPDLPAGLSMKDVVAHLWAWQQRSVARMEAAVQDRSPELPKWPEGLMPDPNEPPGSDDPPDAINAWIYATNRDKPWSRVYQDWREGFLHLIELGEAVPEEDLLKPRRYTWLTPYPLVAVLEGSYEHHHLEHLEPLLAWLGEQGRLLDDGGQGA